MLFDAKGSHAVALFLMLQYSTILISQMLAPSWHYIVRLGSRAYVLYPIDFTLVMTHALIRGCVSVATSTCRKLSTFCSSECYRLDRAQGAVSQDRPSRVYLSVCSTLLLCFRFVLRISIQRCWLIVDPDSGSPVCLLSNVSLRIFDCALHVEAMALAGICIDATIVFGLASKFDAFESSCGATA